MRLEQGRALAEGVCDMLRPYVQTIEIAGSIRREMPEVGDIEIVCVPNTNGGLFGEDMSTLDHGLLQSGINKTIKDGFLDYDPNLKRDGDKYKRLRTSDGYGNALAVDLFIATPTNFGNVFVIRTGDSDWSHLLVTPRDKFAYSIAAKSQCLGKGLMPIDLKQQDGSLWQMRGPDLPPVVIPCPTESAFFRALGLTFVEPRDRNRATANRLRGDS